MGALDDRIKYYQSMPADDPRFIEADKIVERTIALDFDGVLHAYSRGWADGTIYDDPVHGAVEACLALQQAGFELVIFTARQDIPAIDAWLAKHGFPAMPVTHTKPPAALYIDDRALRFVDWLDCLIYIGLMKERRRLG